MQQLMSSSLSSFSSVWLMDPYKTDVTRTLMPVIVNDSNGSQTSVSDVKTNEHQLHLSGLLMQIITD